MHLEQFTKTAEKYLKEVLNYGMLLKQVHLRKTYMARLLKALSQEKQRKLKFEDKIRTITANLREMNEIKQSYIANASRLLLEELYQFKPLL